MSTLSRAGRRGGRPTTRAVSKSIAKRVRWLEPVAGAGGWSRWLEPVAGAGGWSRWLEKELGAVDDDLRQAIRESAAWRAKDDFSGRCRASGAC